MTAPQLFKIFIFQSLFGGTVLLYTSFKNEVTIESIESKTANGHEVFNKIIYLPSPDQDVWLMAQSHDGIHHPIEKWDQIKIVVNKKVEPLEVSYHQMSGGKEVELKASCYTCHANGPRVIRPNYESKQVTYSLQDRVSIAMMNLKIKMYGKTVINNDNFRLHGNWRKVPLKFFGPEDTEPLKIKTCMLCHKADGFFAHGVLQRQHLGTIAHMTKTKQMPPWPFKLNQEEKKKLDKFVRGLN